jgi:hypothetical protein
MPDLEARLRALGDEVAWPETPDLAGAVTAALAARREASEAQPGRLGRAGRRVRSERPARSGRGGRAGEPRAHGVAGVPRRPSRRTVVIALVAALVALPAAGAAAFPGARDDVLEWLGLRRTEVERAPTPPAGETPAALDLGARTDLATAARRAGFRPLVPAGVGPPDAVHVARLGTTTRTTLVYGPRPGLPRLAGPDAGLLVTQVEGAFDGPLLRKVTGPGTRIRRVTVDGHPGLLFTGAPHVYLYLDPSGQVVEDRPWLAGTTLVLERDGAVVRLEAAAGAEALRRLAGSLRVSPRAP